MEPTLGQIVIYTSKIDNGPGNDVLSPAMVIRTRETTVSSVIERWGSSPNATASKVARPDSLIAELPDDDTVDLVVFGLGGDYREYAVNRGTDRGQWIERE